MLKIIWFVSLGTSLVLSVVGLITHETLSFKILLLFSLFLLFSLITIRDFLFGKEIHLGGFSLKSDNTSGLRQFFFATAIVFWFAVISRVR